MRFSLSAIAFAASLVIVAAQDLQGIPTCALACFAAAVPTSGCELTDTKCQCTTGRDSIQQSITDCVPSKCSPQDIASIVPAIEGICGRAGVSISNLPTVSTMSGMNTASRTASTTGASSPTGDTPAQQTSNAAVANMAGVGAAAIGFAAIFL